MRNRTEFEASVLNQLKCSIEKLYDAQGIKYDSRSDCDKTILNFFAWIYRRIPEIPMAVSYSKELTQKISDGLITHDEADILKAFKERLEKGEGMNGFLSKSTLNASKSDYLRFTWHLYHLHMSHKIANNAGEMSNNRSGSQLLAIINNREALFVDVIKHPEKNHDYFDINHLRVIVNNGWMQKIGCNEIQGMIPGSVEPKVVKSEDIYSLYKAGLNILFELDGKGYCLTKGISKNGYPFAVIQALQSIINNIARLDVDGNVCKSVEIQSSIEGYLMILAIISSKQSGMHYYDLMASL